MTPTNRRRCVLLLALHLAGVGALAAPAAAMQILEAVDHAELSAWISADAVSRIALAGDRIAKVVRAPGGHAVEHDPASGDLYLRPAGPGSAAGAPVTLFVGTEKGFTYRLTLRPAERGSAQVLIRNPDALAAADAAPAASGRIGALTALIRAVATRMPLPGHVIEPGGGAEAGLPGLSLIETWRGPRFAAHAVEAGPDATDAAGLAGTMAGLPGLGAVAAVWLGAPGTGPAGGRLAIAVTELPVAAARAGVSR